MPAKGMNSPATRTPASTLTRTNIVSEYATLPRRLGVNGMRTSVREATDHAESLFYTRIATTGDRTRRFVPRLVTNRKISHSEP